MRIRPCHALFALVLSGLLLAGCGRSANPPAHGSASGSASGSVGSAVPARGAPASQPPTSPTSLAASQAASLGPAAPTTGTPTAGAPTAGAPAPLPPVKMAPPPTSFTPRPNDVLSAFAQSLAATVLSMPQTPERDAWYRNQVQTLQTLRVGACTVSTPGTTSTCRVSLSDHEFDAHLMLTQSGWMLVQ